MRPLKMGALPNLNSFPHSSHFQEINPQPKLWQKLMVGEKDKKRVVDSFDGFPLTHGIPQILQVNIPPHLIPRNNHALITLTFAMHS